MTIYVCPFISFCIYAYIFKFYNSKINRSYFSITIHFVRRWNFCSRKFPSNMHSGFAFSQYHRIHSLCLTCCRLFAIGRDTAHVLRRRIKHCRLRNLRRRISRETPLNFIMRVLLTPSIKRGTYIWNTCRNVFHIELELTRRYHELHRKNSQSA